RVEYSPDVITKAFLVLDTRHGETIGGGHFEEVRESQPTVAIGSHEAAAKPVFLRSADGSKAIVVEHEKLVGQIQMADRRQFMNVELEPAIPVPTHGLSEPTCQTGANAGGLAKSHRPQGGAKKDALSSFDPVGKEK